MNDDMKNENNQEQKEKEGAAAPLQKNIWFVAAADATVKKTQAEAEAEANGKVAKSLTPELVEKIKIDKWNGQLPQVEGGATPIVNLEKESEVQ